MFMPKNNNNEKSYNWHLSQNLKTNLHLTATKKTMREQKNIFFAKTNSQQKNNLSIHAIYITYYLVELISISILLKK